MIKLKYSTLHMLSAASLHSCYSCYFFTGNSFHAPKLRPQRQFCSRKIGHLQKFRLPMMSHCRKEGPKTNNQNQSPVHVHDMLCCVPVCIVCSEARTPSWPGPACWCSSWLPPAHASSRPASPSAWPPPASSPPSPSSLPRTCSS